MIIILVFLKLALINGESIQNYFKVLKDQGVNSTLGEPSLISSVFKPSRLTCPTSCSSNSNCTTAVYDNTKGIIRNCFLYNRQFSSNELISSTTMVLYEKKYNNSTLPTTKTKSTVTNKSSTGSSSNILATTVTTQSNLTSNIL